MKFIIDAQLPPRLAEWIRGRGHEVVHVREVDLVQAADGRIWDLALTTDAVIVTKDRDFMQWCLVRRPAPQIVWLKFGNIGTAALIARVEMAWPKIVAGLERRLQVVQVGGRA